MGMMTDTLEQILAEVKAHTGLDFLQYRRQHMVSRIADRMTALGCSTTEAYWEQLRGDPAECRVLAELLSINVTCFFRNSIVFEILAQRVFPELLEEKRAEGSRELRVWSVGCASGEEPYSVAIMLRQRRDRGKDDRRRICGMKQMALLAVDDRPENLFLIASIILNARPGVPATGRFHPRATLQHGGAEGKTAGYSAAGCHQKRAYGPSSRAAAETTRGAERS